MGRPQPLSLKKLPGGLLALDHIVKLSSITMASAAVLQSVTIAIPLDGAIAELLPSHVSRGADKSVIRLDADSFCLDPRECPRALRGELHCLAKSTYPC